MVDRIRALFPDIPEENQLAPPPPNSPAGGLNALSAGLRALADTGVAPPGTDALYGWFAGQAAYQAELAALEKALYPSLLPEPFGLSLIHI